jgi:hypothetical protein
MALAALESAHVHFAVLHKEHLLFEGHAPSDVDLVVDRPPSEVICACLGEWRARGLVPIAVWPYDIGAKTVFLTTRALDEGVQLDLNHDPRGLGRYGFKSPSFLNRAEPGSRWKRLSAQDQLTYLLSKRSEKGDLDEVARLLLQVQEHRPDLLATVRSSFATPVAQRISGLLSGRSPTTRLRPIRALATVPRMWARLVQPVGYWVHLDGADQAAHAEQIRRSFDRVLVVCEAVHLTGTITDVRQIIRVATVRWRAGIVLTYGKQTPRISPDLVLAPAPESTQIEKIVDAMGARAVARCPAS